MKKLSSLAILCSSLTSQLAAAVPGSPATTSLTLSGSFGLSRTGGQSILPGVHNVEQMLLLRGGATDSNKKKKGKKKKNKTKGKAKKAIDEAMKEKDSAEAMGDAIRSLASELRQETYESDDPFLQSIDGSVRSVGRAMGASDFDVTSATDAGGVEASPTSVIANYFLKSHGGAHLLQSVSSVLATTCGLGSLFMVSKYSPTTNTMGNAKWTLVLLRRSLVFAMVKHISGLLASASVAAKAINKIGISRSRKWMEEIVREPVAQYVFYAALLLVWLPSKSLLLTTTQDDQNVPTTWWWPRQRWIVSCMLGPVLLREIVSNILIVSDVLVLWSVGSKGESTALESILRVSQSVVNAVMSLLVSPTKWRSADSPTRQEILAGLVSKISLFLEAGVGAILLLDLGIGLLATVLGSVMGGRPAWYEMLTKFIVIRLYIHYLVWLRRKNLSKLATEIRGGAAELPFWFLDTLYDPAKAVGLSKAKVFGGDSADLSSWTKLFSVGFGLENTAAIGDKQAP